MATIIKRNGSFRVQINRKGKRLSATFDTKAQAEVWAYQMEAMILNDENLEQEIIVNEALSVIDVFEKYKNTVSPKKRGFVKEKIRIEKLCRDPAFAIPIERLTNKALAVWRDKRLTQVQPLTVKRELILISAILNTAIKEWGVDLSHNPVQMIQQPKNPRPRNQRISEENKLKIIEQLNWDMKTPPVTTSQWVAFAFCLALATAMRRGEICSFTWGDLYLEESYIHLDMTKNGDERNVPLSTKAKSLLKLLIPQSKNVRVVAVTPDVLSSTFRKAKIAVGLENIRFHDARREATTQFAEKLSNPLELSAVTGHKDINLLRSTYYNPDASKIAKKLD
ncbi:site-specific integrase [Commensalibacter nepenthis]|uniref:Site-specific integrase n=1 Tax=Commensalibacter nepenthis TaxID=3043872 RepID=A0ABT6Q7Z8_9PROT|nr:site-specific integrase [Commensalibacter sp. TBRC 10068]MDI2113036.1 site-specific integrase [Commensalibacter sp. TBRC 10068]